MSKVKTEHFFNIIIIGDREARSEFTDANRFRSFLQLRKLHLIILLLEKLQENVVCSYSKVNALLKIMADHLPEMF